MIGLLSKYYMKNEPFINYPDEIRFHSLNKYLLSAYNALGTVLDIGYTTVNKTVPALKRTQRTRKLEGFIIV